MAVVSLIATCAACWRVFSCNPRTVPSIRVDGVREPLCETCARNWNTLHPDRARPIAPDAYTPVDETEFGNDD